MTSTYWRRWRRKWRVIIKYILYLEAYCPRKWSEEGYYRISLTLHLLNVYIGRLGTWHSEREDTHTHTHREREREIHTHTHTHRERERERERDVLYILMMRSDNLSGNQSIFMMSCALIALSSLEHDNNIMVFIIIIIIIIVIIIRQWSSLFL